VFEVLDDQESCRFGLVEVWLDTEARGLAYLIWVSVRDFSCCGEVATSSHCNYSGLLITSDHFSTIFPALVEVLHCISRKSILHNAIRTAIFRRTFTAMILRTHYQAFHQFTM
jgi:hypothetical protein